MIPVLLLNCFLSPTICRDRVQTEVTPFCLSCTYPIVFLQLLCCSGCVYTPWTCHPGKMYHRICLSSKRKLNCTRPWPVFSPRSRGLVWDEPNLTQGTVESGAMGWVALWKRHKIIVASSVTKSSGRQCRCKPGATLFDF